MIKAVHDNGPYIVISKHIALAHARTECGALHTDISFATLEPAVNFGAGDLDPVKLISLYQQQILIHMWIYWANCRKS